MWSISTFTPRLHLCFSRQIACYSLCNTTINPIIPSITWFSHGCSLSRIVTYPTNGMKPNTLPITSSSRLRNDWSRAYSSVSSARLLSPFVRRRSGVLLYPNRQPKKQFTETTAASMLLSSPKRYEKCNWCDQLSSLFYRQGLGALCAQPLSS